MEERLIQLLKSEGINPTRFAERIGVQRSSMSHILSGRNKPSYDFIIKILDSFPAVNPDWLLRGKGLMYKNDVPVQPSLFDVVQRASAEPLDNTLKEAETDPRVNNPSGNSSFSQMHKVLDGSVLDESQNLKTIDKIVVFYSDKTFSDYSRST